MSIGDHIRAKPTVVVVSGIVGPAPLYLGEGFPDSDARVQRAFEELQAMQAERVPLELLTSKKTYTMMVPTVVSITVDKDTGLALSADVTFKQLKTATTATVTLPDPKLPSGEATKKGGRKTGEEAEVSEKDVSRLRTTATWGAAKMGGGLPEFEQSLRALRGAD